MERANASGARRDGAAIGVTNIPGNSGTRGLAVKSGRPEVELLLCAACLQLSEAGRARILCLLESEIDWDWLVHQAFLHGLLPLLYRHLDALATAQVPKPVFVELWAHHERVVRRNQAMARELVCVLRTLDEHGIPAIPFKGPALAAAVYGDLALREFGDLDILVRPEDVLPAKRLLQTRGYVPEYDLKPAVEAALLRSGTYYHLVMVQAGSEIPVELHWKTDVDFPVEPQSDDQWWARLEYESLGDDRVRCFGSEELLLILFLHGSKHAWASLGWLVDVSEMIRQRPEMNWNWIVAKAAELKCERRLAVGVHLAEQLLETPLPEMARRTLRDSKDARELAAEVMQTLFLQDTAPVAPMKGFFLRLRLAEERPWRQLLLVKNAVVAPTLMEWSRWPLPRLLFFLYLPLRIFRLVVKYGRRI